MQKEERIPLDRWLIQESLKKAAEGPQALMEWATENYSRIDHKFMNQLRKMEEYAHKQNDEKQAKMFEFLQRCFFKMFDFEALMEPVAITKENFKQNFAKANTLLKQGKAKAAIPMLQALLLFVTHNSGFPYQALLNANMGIAFAQLKAHEQAIFHLERAAIEPLKDIQQEKVRANLGTIYRDLKDFPSSVEQHLKALELAQKRGDYSMQFVHLNNIALVHLDQKHLDHALDYQHQAYDIALKLENNRLIHDCVTRLAVIYGLKGDNDLCQKFCSEGLAMVAKDAQKKKNSE